MVESPSPSPEEEKDHAEAGWLVGDQSQAPPAPVPSSPAADTPAGGYDLDGSDPVVPDEVVPPVPAPPPRKPAPKPKPESRPPDAERPVATVDQVWSRWGEWGPNLLVLLGVGAGTAFLLYLALATGSYRLAFFLFVVGAAALGVLSYPILITLERPVRVTPEQAAKDYYVALSHLRPHYRRMWLLLSSAGRDSGPFASFEDFKTYWNEQLTALRGDRGGRLACVRFEIEDFRSEKSAGLTAVDATFTVHAFLDETRAEGPLSSFLVKTGFVKGPDRMWYLNQGTLPAKKS